MQHRANNFDALRLLGALMVFYSHQFALAGHDEPLLDAGTNTTFGSLGVYLFFSISGFLILQSWRADPDAHRFIQRRFLRIWPGMAAAIVASALFLWAVTPVDGWQVLGYLSNLWCLGCNQGNAFFPANAHTGLYGSMWTIPLEVQCYALVLAAGMLFRRHLGVFVTLLAGMAMLVPLAREFVPLIVLERIHAAGWRWPSAGVCGAFFLAGCVICCHAELRARAWLPVLGGVLLMARGHVMEGMVFALPAATVWIGTRSWPVMRDAGRFGDLSYGIYLWAWPVQQMVVMAWGRVLPLAALGALSLALTLVLAWASWHLVENRALKLKPRSAASGSPGGAPGS